MSNLDLAATHLLQSRVTFLSDLMCVTKFGTMERREIHQSTAGNHDVANTSGSSAPSKLTVKIQNIVATVSLGTSRLLFSFSFPLRLYC